MDTDIAYACGLGLPMVVHMWLPKPVGVWFVF